MDLTVILNPTFFTVSGLSGVIGVLLSIMENSAEDSRIQSFDLDTQVLLKTALKGTLAYYCFIGIF